MTRHMVPGLRHRHAGVGKETFFAEIDAAGGWPSGWPLGYRYVGFEHTESRAAGFTNSPHNDGWWTVVASSDDYYLWKLSPEALQRVVAAAISAIQIPVPDAQKLWIRDSRGDRAVIAKGEKEQAK